MKYCIDCKYFVEAQMPFRPEAYCIQQATGTDLVYGTKKYPTAREARKYQFICGPDGANFEPKTTNLRGILHKVFPLWVRSNNEVM